MIPTRSARTIRGAILDARKFKHLAARGYALQSVNLKGLYGRAYLRTFWAYEPQIVAGPRPTGPLGLVWG